ncbi:MAG: dienelactone hydrolase family protein [Polyangiaceae bacterium]
MILEESTVTLETPTGAMQTYIYRPVGAGRHPGVVLFSEIFQRTGPIGRMAAMLAGHGFVVAVPEIFHELEPAGTVLAYDQAGADAGNHHKTAKTVAAYDADARTVLDHLLARDDTNGELNTMGVCIGGHLAFRCGLDPRVRATACFYATDLHKGTLGRGGDDSLARAGEIEGELLMVWGRQDPHIPDEGRAKIQARLVETKRRFTWHELNAAHAFLRDEGPRYDPALALLAYRMAIDLFTSR